MVAWPLWRCEAVVEAVGLVGYVVVVLQTMRLIMVHLARAEVMDDMVILTVVLIVQN